MCTYRGFLPVCVKCLQWTPVPVHLFHSSGWLWPYSGSTGKDGFNGFPIGVFFSWSLAEEPFSEARWQVTHGWGTLSVQGPRVFPRQGCTVQLSHVDLEWELSFLYRLAVVQGWWVPSLLSPGWPRLGCTFDLLSAASLSSGGRGSLVLTFKADFYSSLRTLNSGTPSQTTGQTRLTGEGLGWLPSGGEEEKKPKKKTEDRRMK